MEFIIGFLLGASCAAIGLFIGICVLLYGIADRHGVWLRSKNDGW